MEFFGFIVMKRGYTVSCYSATNGKLNSVYADCLYTDAKGRIWVGTGGSGLNLYDEATDTFLPVHAKWNLPEMRLSVSGVIKRVIYGWVRMPD